MQLGLRTTDFIFKVFLNLTSDGCVFLNSLNAACGSSG